MKIVRVRKFWGESLTTCGSMHAGDTVLIAESESDLRAILDFVTKNSEEKGLDLKTKENRLQRKHVPSHPI